MSDDPTTDETHDSDAQAQTGPDQPLSDREDGGPTSTGEVQDDVVEGGHGDRPAPFEPHE